MKNLGLISRLFGRKPARHPVCEDQCWKGWWWRYEWRGGGCVPVAAIRPCTPEELAAAALAGGGPAESTEGKSLLDADDAPLSS